MTETTAPPRVGDLYSDYLGTLNPERRVSDGMYVRQFCEFIGVETTVDLLTGSRVDSFVEQRISESDPNASDRVKALKDWFKFLKKEGYTETNLGTRVRLPRPGRQGRTGPALRKEEGSIQLTPEGIAQLKEELTKLEEERPELVEAVTRAREDKDFRENAPLEAAREALSYTDSRIRQIKESLKRAVVVEHQDNNGMAAVGSTVKVTHVGKGTSHTYVLVNPQEANARENKISVKSPVGSQLLGCTAGDDVIVDVPSGTLHLRVEDVTS